MASDDWRSLEIEITTKAKETLTTAEEVLLPRRCRQEEKAEVIAVKATRRASSPSREMAGKMITRVGIPSTQNWRRKSPSILLPPRRHPNSIPRRPANPAAHRLKPPKMHVPISPCLPLKNQLSITIRTPRVASNVAMRDSPTRRRLANGPPQSRAKETRNRDLAAKARISERNNSSSNNSSNINARRTSTNSRSIISNSNTVPRSRIPLGSRSRIGLRPPQGTR